MPVELKLDIDNLNRPLGFVRAVRRDADFIVSQALNATLTGINPIQGSKRRNIRTILEEKSTSFLDRPKAQIQKGWFPSEWANKNHLFAGLNFKDKPFNTYRYLYPHIAGEKREPKSYEQLFRNHPLGYGLPANTKLVPNAENFKGKLKIDKYGNVSRSSINYIYQNTTKGATRSSHRSSLTAKKVSLKSKGVKSEPTFLIGKPLHGNRPAGIYWRRAANHQLWLIFKAVNEVQYKSVYKVSNVMDIGIKAKWMHNLERSMQNNVPKWVDRT